MLATIAYESPKDLKRFRAVACKVGSSWEIFEYPQRNL